VHTADMVLDYTSAYASCNTTHTC